MPRGMVWPNQDFHAACQCCREAFRKRPSAASRSIAQLLDFSDVALPTICLSENVAMASVGHLKTYFVALSAELELPSSARKGYCLALSRQIPDYRRAHVHVPLAP